MTLLGVNIDHVATVRNARGGSEPDPLTAALIAEQNGADSIVCHLREDRRHIRDRDVRVIREAVQTSMQLEMALHEGVIAIALEVAPAEIMVVPERREEITTEGGFDCVRDIKRLGAAVEKFKAAGIGVSVFVDGDRKQIEVAHRLGAHTVELHTGPYAHARTEAEIDRELSKLEEAASVARELGLVVHAGHGLNYYNITRLLHRLDVAKVNIGHSIVSRAVFTGFDRAVREMKALVMAART